MRDEFGEGVVASVFREVHGHAVATLVRAFGDITVAEDAVQDAFVVAMGRWPVDGIPSNPAGWIVTTARNRGIDRLRRTNRGQEVQQQLARQPANEPSMVSADAAFANDDRLRLIFTCCHPALRTDHQVALTLRLLGGLSVEEIARGFVVSDAAMAKRLVRAKFKVKAANIPYRIPAPAELAGRLRPVLSVLYLIYTAGTDDLDGRTVLRTEAIRLTRALRVLMPDEPEVAGLLALMLLNESRVTARQRDGAVVLLRDQDRNCWEPALIAEGSAIVRSCIRTARPGPYQLQAAIQAVHSNAPTFDVTDWGQIVTLYDHLADLLPTPVVALNRAIAVAELDGAASGLAELDAIGTVLDQYWPWHAARASLLHRLERNHDARDAYQRAAALASPGPDRDYVLHSITELAI